MRKRLGTTAMDWIQQEQERGITIISSVASAYGLLLPIFSLYVKLHLVPSSTQKKAHSANCKNGPSSLFSVFTAKMNQRFRRASRLHPPFPSPLPYSLPPRVLISYIWGDRSLQESDDPWLHFLSILLNSLFSQPQPLG
jgi:hypothetical protein